MSCTGGYLNYCKEKLGDLTGQTIMEAHLASVECCKLLLLWFALQVLLMSDNKDYLYRRSIKKIKQLKHVQNVLGKASNDGEKLTDKN